MERSFGQVIEWLGREGGGCRQISFLLGLLPWSVRFSCVCVFLGFCSLFFFTGIFLPPQICRWMGEKQSSRSRKSSESHFSHRIAMIRMYTVCPLLSVHE